MKRIVLIINLLLLAGVAMAQTDMTCKIVNPSFEQDLDGWENDGMQAQSNTAFKLKVGGKYCEKWTGSGGQVGNGSIYQTISQLPAGTYTITVVAQNIQEGSPTTKQTGVYLVANDQKTKVNVAATYSVSATIFDGELRIGYLIQSATGNYATVDDFHLTLEAETDEMFQAIHTGMQTLVDEAKAANKHVGDTPEQKELDAATAALEVLIGKNTTVGVTEAVQRLKDAIYDYKLSKASETETMDMTDKITNPDFEKNGAAGWVNEGMAAQGNTSFSIKHGGTYMERWTGRGGKVGDGLLSQRVTLPNGKYVMTAAAQNIQEDYPSKKYDGAWIFADEYETLVYARNTYTLEFVVIEGQANIGFRAKNAQGNWIAVDNFKLTYKGRTDEMLLDALAARIAKAEQLATEQMNATALKNLQDAISAAKDVTGKTGMEPAAIALRECMEVAQTSIEAYAGLQKVIAESEGHYDATKKGADEFIAAINAAKACYDNNENTDAQVAAAQKALEDAGLLFNINNATGTIPTVTTCEYIPRGATGALGRCTVKGTNILETGFCWSTEHNPTVFDNKSTDTFSNNGTIYYMHPMNPSTVYYVRPYAITKTYAVGYGEERKVVTTPMGNISYWYNNGGDAATNERIINSLNECVELYDNWSTTTNYSMSVSYSPGTPTADCSYGGSMRVGSNTAYQATGTILHESNHGVGVGQQGRWWDGNLHNGDWFGERANQLVRFFENNQSARLHGDDQHMWPYGINGAQEDSHQRILYIANVLITQGLHEDGLIPPGHGGCKPAYTFESDDSVKYYITNENDNYGCGKSYLTESATGVLTWSTPQESIIGNDAYAWYVEYNPKNCLYRIRNVKSGKYFSYSSGIKTVTKTNPGETEYFHLMNARITKYLGVEGFGLTTRGYWILAGNDVAEPAALNAVANGKTNSQTFNLANSATSQRWIFLSEAELDKLEHSGVDINRDKLKRLIEGSRNLVQVPHEDAKDNATSNLESAADDMESAMQEMTGVSELLGGVSSIWTSITDFLQNTTLKNNDEPFDITFMLDDSQMTDASVWGGEAPNVSNGCSEFKEKEFSMTQELTSMPKGVYAGLLQAFQRPGTATNVYSDYLAGTPKSYAQLTLGSITHDIVNIAEGAREEKIGVGTETAVGTPTYYVPSNLKAASAYFDEGKYENWIVYKVFRNGNSFSLGIKGTSPQSNYWTAFRNYRLFFYGGDADKNEVTGIEEVSETARLQANEAFNLNGQAVSSDYKGVVIKNCKKVLVR